MYGTVMSTPAAICIRVDDVVLGLTVFTGATVRCGVVAAVGEPVMEGDDPVYLACVRRGREGQKMTLRHCTFSSRPVVR